MSARIVLAALALEPRGSGVQTYIRELMRELPGAIERDVGGGVRISAIVQRDAVGLLPAGIEARPQPNCRGLRRTWGSARPVGTDALVHALDVDLPWRREGPRVTTVHDLAVFDVPEAFSRSRVVVKRRMTAHAIRTADTVIAVSEFTAERVAHHFGVDAVVIHEAVPPDCAPAPPAAVDAIRARLDLPTQFVLYVGNLEPRKDVPTLAEACRRAGVPLVVAGAHITTVAVPGGAHSVGHVDRADLPALYGAASIVGYVSRYEGFGLPPLEALACGAAVVCTRSGALPEVVPGAARFVPAGDSEAQAAAIGELLADPDQRHEIVARGARELAALSWARAARETAAVYQLHGVVPG